MTAEQFLMALRRFISRKGTPKEIILDNASQFKLTKTTIDKAWQRVVMDEDVHSYTANQNIKWKFIVEFAPWVDGFYERLVGMVKSSLRKAIGRTYLTQTQFTTFTTESEVIINSRPLVYIDGDINSTNAIAPMHFLSLNPKIGTPSPTEDLSYDDPDYKPKKETSDELLQICKKGQVHLNNLWKIWRDEYLLSLRERFKNQIKTTNTLSKLYPKIGQIVHIKENLPRGAWKLGKIIKLIESEDGEIRAATLLPTRNTVNRPINLLYPLETAPVSDELNSDPLPHEQIQQEENGLNIKQVSERPSTYQQCKITKIYRK